MYGWMDGRTDDDMTNVTVLLYNHSECHKSDNPQEARS